ncbi:MAG: hemin uptake protein HemP [bacterium]|nr:hemin uptake protein HemP [bacterium]
MAFVEPPGDQNRPSERESASIPKIPKIPKIIGFEALARCGDEVWIENNGQIYRLRRTRQGKLILTK